PPDVMSCREDVGDKLGCGLEQLPELDLLVAGDARNGGLAGEIAVGERGDHRVLEAVLVVQDVMRNVELLGHSPGIVDVLTGAAASVAGRCRSVIVELQGDADDIV